MEEVNNRINVLVTPDEWFEFGKLVNKHGLTKTSIMTRIFRRTIQLMKDNPSLFDKIDEVTEI